MPLHIVGVTLFGIEGQRAMLGRSLSWRHVVWPVLQGQQAIGVLSQRNLSVFEGHHARFTEVFALCYNATTLKGHLADGTQRIVLYTSHHIFVMLITHLVAEESSLVSHPLVDGFGHGIGQLADEAELLSGHTLLLVVMREGACRSGHVVGRENIYPDALVIFVRTAACMCWPAGRLAVAQLGMTMRIVIVGIDILQEVGMLEFIAQLHQFVIVFAHHHHIDVIVPWYETFVTNSAKHRTAIGIDAQAMTLAHFDELEHQVYLHSPDMFHLGRYLVSTPLLFYQKRFGAWVFECHKELI